MSSNPLIYLASASPRRSALLAQIGVAHRARAVDVDERPLPGEPAGQYVQRLAIAKAQTLWNRLPAAGGHAVLGADTAVVIDAEILGKPRDENDCVRMLQLLSGRTHQVFTAIALRHNAGCDCALNVSDVTFRALASEEMLDYWRSAEPADKAGAYAVQGLGAVFIERIAGSYSAIMGLPLFETARLLGSIGWRFSGDASRAGPCAVPGARVGQNSGEAHG